MQPGQRRADGLPDNVRHVRDRPRLASSLHHVFYYRARCRQLRRTRGVLRDRKLAEVALPDRLIKDSRHRRRARNGGHQSTEEWRHSSPLFLGRVHLSRQPSTPLTTTDLPSTFRAPFHSTCRVEQTPATEDGLAADLDDGGPKIG